MNLVTFSGRNNIPKFNSVPNSTDQTLIIFQSVWKTTEKSVKCCVREICTKPIIYI